MPTPPRPEYVQFELQEYATELTDAAQVEVCCKITSELSLQYNLRYGEDFWFECSYWDSRGIRIIEFGFKDPQLAFISKLKGIL